MNHDNNSDNQPNPFAPPKSKVLDDLFIAAPESWSFPGKIIGGMIGLGFSALMYQVIAGHTIRILVLPGITCFGLSIALNRVVKLLEVHHRFLGSIAYSALAIHFLFWIISILSVFL